MSDWAGLARRESGAVDRHTRAARSYDTWGPVRVPLRDYEPALTTRGRDHERG